VSSPPIQIDVLIVGAGPVGLFQAFQLGLQELSVQILDAHHQIGGQCSALYPDKFIYDIPGFPRITAQQLVDQLQAQIEPFNFPIHLGQLVQSVQTLEQNQGFLVSTQSGLQFQTRCIIIAAGVGAFVHKELPLPELKELRSKQRQVLKALPEDAALGEKNLVIYGGDERAVQLSLEAAKLRSPKGSVTLVFRRERLEIDTTLQSLLDQEIARGNLAFKVAQITAIQENPSQGLSHLILIDTQGVQSTVACEYLLESLGLSPKLGPLLDWEIEMERKALKVNTETFCTSTPGIYAVGDINTYPGKRKLILSGFHEATLAAFAVAAQLRGGQSVPLEYTSASSRIHKLLGVKS